MCEYVVLHALRIHRKLPDIENASKAGTWHRDIVPPASETTVGVMGMGNLGAAVANALKSIGFSVKGLSKSGNQVDDIEVYSHEKSSDFFKNIDIAVSLLPETPETDNIFCNENLSLMPRGSWVINAGRGNQVKDKDLVEQIEKGHIVGAVLDVFRTEPLPSEHIFWNNPKILITGHSASPIEADVGCKIIAENLKAFVNGEDVPDLVDRQKGY